MDQAAQINRQYQVHYSVVQSHQNREDSSGRQQPQRLHRSHKDYSARRRLRSLLEDSLAQVQLQFHLLRPEVACSAQQQPLRNLSKVVDYLEV